MLLSEVDIFAIVIGIVTLILCSIIFCVSCYKHHHSGHQHYNLYTSTQYENEYNKFNTEPSAPPGDYYVEPTEAINIQPVYDVYSQNQGEFIRSN